MADGADIVTSYALANGKRTVYMPVTKRADASTLSVVELVKANIPKFKQVLPDDIEVTYEFDQSPYVVRAIRDLVKEGALGAVLTGLMVLLFLRDWRSAFIVVINIPIALLAGTFALWVSGQNINLMTLGGLALAVGILVDEATVKGANHQRKKVTLVTHSLKFNRAHWLTIDAMEKHWEPARVEAKLGVDGLVLNVENVSIMTMKPPRVQGATLRKGAITVGPQTEFMFEFGGNLDSGPDPTLRFVKAANKWSLTVLQATYSRAVAPQSLAKVHNLQGPIDDAFMDSFVMVRPTYEPMNAASGQWVKTELAEAAFHWRRYFRGEARVKDDVLINADDIRDSNLILWGDPQSNKLLQRIAPMLPIKWDGKVIKVGDKTYDATTGATITGCDVVGAIPATAVRCDFSSATAACAARALSSRTSWSSNASISPERSTAISAPVR